MFKVFVAATIGLLLPSFASTAEAQNVGSYLTPETFDLSGHWYLPGGVTIGRYRYPAANCVDQLFRETNYAIFGRDYFRLEPISAEVDPEDSSRIIIEYDGEFHHFHSFGHSEACAPTECIQYDYLCFLYELEFDVHAMQVFSPTPGHFELSIDITNQIDPPYEHGTSGGLARHPDWRLFQDVRGDQLNLSFGFADPRGGTAPLPAGCEVELEELRGQVIRNAGCTETVKAVMPYRRTDRPPNIIPTATVTGTILESLPDGTPTVRTVPRAVVALYQQDEYVRARGQNESVDDYARYLADRRGRRRKLAEVMPGEDGRFSASRLPALERLSYGGRSTWRRALYTIEVTQGERDEIDANTLEETTLHFATGIVYNVRAGDDATIYVQALQTLAAKQALVQRLTELSPLRYGPVEARVNQYLVGLANATIQPTPERIEGLRRAVWAERGVRDGAEYVKPMIDAMLDQIAGLVSEVVGKLKSFKSREVAENKMRVDNLREAQNFERLNGQGFSSLGGTGAARQSELLGKIEDLRTTTGVADRELADQLKALFKTVFLIPMKHTLGDALGIPEIGFYVFVMEKMVNLLVEALCDDLGGAVDDTISLVVQEAVKSAADDLFDNPLGLPFALSFAERTQPHLDMSDLRMRAWNSANPTVYRADREETVRILNELGADATETLNSMEFALALQSGFSDASDVFGTLGEVDPKFKVAEAWSKVAAYVSSAAAIIGPAVAIFYTIPRGVEDAAYAAYGLEPPQSLRLVTLGPSITTNRHRDILPPLDRKIRIAAFEIMQALEVDDLPTVIDRAGDPDPMIGLVAAREDLFRRVKLALSQPLAAAVADPRLSSGLAEAFRVRATFASESLRAIQLLQDFLLNVFEERYSGPTDPLYLAERARVLRALDALDALSGDLSIATGNAWAFDLDAGVLPNAVVVSLAVVSETTQRSIISASGEVLRVRAEIQNTGTSTLGGMVARLRVRTPSGATTLLDSADQAVPVLDAYTTGDGGPDTFAPEWRFSYDGAETAAENVVVAVELINTTSATISTTDATLVLSKEPSLVDSDLDGITDEDELRTGLDPASPDFNLDADGDQLANGVEIEIGTDPNVVDTDGDGLSDWEETRSGADGYITDPLDDDTDGDTVLDGVDGVPTDGTTSAAGELIPEPILNVDLVELTLSPQQPLVLVDVTNRGGGELAWTAISDNEALATTTPAAPAIREGNGKLMVMAPGRFDFEGADGLETRVRLANVSGVRREIVEIAVHIRSESAPGLDAGTRDGATNPGADASVGRDGSVNLPDLGPIPGFDAGAEGVEEGGCGCAVAQTPASATRSLLWAALLLLLAFVRRRRL